LEPDLAVGGVVFHVPSLVDRRVELCSGVVGAVLAGEKVDEEPLSRRAVAACSSARRMRRTSGTRWSAASRKISFDRSRQL